MEKRIIKFRVWDKESQAMIQNDNSLIIRFEGNEVVVTYIGTEWKEGGGETYEQDVYENITNFELMQFTGLQDKNGKDIYEGDVLKCSWLAELGVTEIDCEANGIVLWNNDNPCFYAHLIKKYTRNLKDGVYEETDSPIFTKDYHDGYSFEIIGNIYENHELLTP